MTDADFRESLARAIKERREAMELSQRELAARSGVSSGTISKIETTQLSPTVEILSKLAAGLGMELGALIDHVVPREGARPRMRPTYRVASGTWAEMAKDLVMQVVTDVGSRKAAATALEITTSKLSRLMA